MREVRRLRSVHMSLTSDFITIKLHIPGVAPMEGSHLQTRTLAEAEVRARSGQRLTSCHNHYSFSSGRCHLIPLRLLSVAAYVTYRKICKDGGPPKSSQLLLGPVAI